MSSSSKQMKETAPVTQLIALPDLPAHPGQGAAVLGQHMSLFDNVQVTLTVQVGQVHSTVGELMALREHALLKIDRALAMPVDVSVNGAVVAQGELVAVDDNFGVRITAVAARQQTA